MITQLTPNQLLAINTFDKNLQIIACAGSGKTHVKVPLMQARETRIRGYPDTTDTRIRRYDIPGHLVSRRLSDGLRANHWLLVRE